MVVVEGKKEMGIYQSMSLKFQFKKISSGDLLYICTHSL